MYDSIHDYCQVGIVVSQIFPRSQKSEEMYLEALDTILKDPYFDFVELGRLPFESLYEKVKKNVELAHSFLTYSGHSILFQGKLNINSLDENERVKAVRELEKGIDEAYNLGSKEFQFLSRTYDEDRIEDALIALARSTGELTSYAREKGIDVVMELFDHDIDKCSLLGPAKRAVRFLELLEDCQNFGFMVDLSHIPMIGESLDENLDPVKNHIRHAHIGNTLISNKKHHLYGDLHPRFGYPGSENDVNETAAFLQKLYDFGYLYKGGDNLLSFEIRPDEGEDENLVIAGSKRVLDKAWRLVRKGHCE